MDGVVECQKPRRENYFGDGNFIHCRRRLSAIEDHALDVLLSHPFLDRHAADDPGHAIAIWGESMRFPDHDAGSSLLQ